MEQATKPIDGGPAFPNAIPANSDNWPLGSVGMSLRDYFAAKAMALIVHAGLLDTSSHRIVAEHSYKFADAMLKARES